MATAQKNKNLYSKLTPYLLPAIGGFLIFFLSWQTLEHPLLEDHCMKTAKSVEVSYNLVRYGDPISQYVDWHATPSNTKGIRGNIFTYESPLSAYLLAGIYLIVDGADFESRVNAARLFTLASLVTAYFLLWFFVFRKNLFAFAVFSFLYVYSFFPIYYSTKPQAETFSLMYQALFIVASARLLVSKKSVGYQMATLAGLVCLLVLGGKMNYFIVAFPLMVCFPFLSDKFTAKKPKLIYYGCFGFIAVAALSVMNILPGFSLERVFLYMIKGNKPVIDNSLWTTFLEGFDGFESVWKRTRADYGAITFYGGILGSGYLVSKFIYLLKKRCHSPITSFEQAQLVFFFMLVGHALNYVVLRNLFIPHRYYVVPFFPVMCLAITVMFADIRSFVFEPVPAKSWISSKFSTLFEALSDGLKKHMRSRFALTKSIWRISLILLFVGLAFRVFGERILGEEEFRLWFVHTLQYFGNQNLVVTIEKQALEFANSSSGLGNTFLIGAPVSLVVAILLGLSKKIASLRIVFVIDKLFQTLRLNTLSISFVAILIVSGCYATLENTELFYDNAVVQQENILLAASIEKVRKDTKSGDLVLCWKPCIAFYADKRSITSPNDDDLDFYIENDVHSVLGPVKPFDVYYNQIKKYLRPATYYKLKKSSQIKRIRKVKAGVKVEETQ